MNTPTYPDTETARSLRSTRPVRTTVACTVAGLLLAGSAFLINSRSEPTAEFAGDPPGTSQTFHDARAMSPEEQAAAIEAQLATGWIAYSGDDALTRVAPEGIVGWVRHGESLEPGKKPVYDQPNGTVIGYAYSQLGFVALDHDADFDADAERIKRLGCNQFADPSCVPTDAAPPGIDVPQPRG